MRAPRLRACAGRRDRCVHTRCAVDRCQWPTNQQWRWRRPRFRRESAAPVHAPVSGIGVHALGLCQSEKRRACVPRIKVAKFTDHVGYPVGTEQQVEQVQEGDSVVFPLRMRKGHRRAIAIPSQIPNTNKNAFAASVPPAALMRRSTTTTQSTSTLRQTPARPPTCRLGTLDHKSNHRRRGHRDTIRVLLNAAIAARRYNHAETAHTHYTPSVASVISPARAAAAARLLKASGMSTHPTWA